MSQHTMTSAELREARKRLGLTQAQLADEIGIAANTVMQYERGYRYNASKSKVVVPHPVKWAVRWFENNPPPN